MPKRSNKFQRLVLLLQQQLAGSGAVVTESKMMVDRKTGELAEVDVAVEFMANGIPVSFGFEARGSRRKLDRNAAMAIVTKYSQLVDKTVIVSSAGFSRGALKHCKMNGAVAITLSSAKGVDWGGFLEAFKELYFASFDFAVDGGPTVSFAGDQSPEIDPEQPADVIDPQGQRLPMPEAITALLRAADAGKAVMQEWYAKPEAERETVYRKTITYTVHADKAMYVEQDGKRFRIGSIAIPVRVSTSARKFQLSPMNFHDHRVMQGAVTLDVGGLAGKEIMVAFTEEGVSGNRAGAILIPEQSGEPARIHRVQLVPPSID